MEKESRSKKMSEQTEMKVCKMCAMEIPAKARKCPHCHHWQSRFHMVVWHPAFAIVFLIPLMIAYGLMMGTFFDRGKDFQPYRDQVKVTSTEIKFSDDPNSEHVAVVGRLKNDSDRDWKELILSVEFYDAEGKLVDGGQDVKYAYYIAAHDEGSFRVLFQRHFPKESYISCNVKVVYAKEGRTVF
jgi:ribosomal protein L40E